MTAKEEVVKWKEHADSAFQKPHPSFARYKTLAARVSILADDVIRLAKVITALEKHLTDLETKND